MFPSEFKYPLLYSSMACHFRFMYSINHLFVTALVAQLVLCSFYQDDQKILAKKTSINYKSIKMFMIFL